MSLPNRFYITQSAVRTCTKCHTTTQECHNVIREENLLSAALERQ